MAKDLLLDKNYDLLIRDGDLVVGNSEEQEVALIMLTDQGDWRAAPLVGFGVGRRMRGEITPGTFERDLSTQLQLDGFTQAQVRLSPTGQLTINAQRNG